MIHVYAPTQAVGLFVFIAKSSLSWEVKSLLRKLKFRQKLSFDLKSLLKALKG